MVVSGEWWIERKRLKEVVVDKAKSERSIEKAKRLTLETSASTASTSPEAASLAAAAAAAVSRSA